MDYFLSDDVKAIRELCAEIAEKHIKPVREELDRENRFPHEIMNVLADSDLFRIYIPEEYEGLGLGSMSLCVAAEELSRACAGIATSYAANALGAMPILLFGTDGQKRKYLPGLASGKAWRHSGSPSPTPEAMPAASEPGRSATATPTSSTEPSSGSRTAARRRFTPSSP